MVCVDSRSCLQAVEGLHIEHPLVLEILEVLCAPRVRQKHLSIWGNELTDRVAKAALKDGQQNMKLP